MWNYVKNKKIFAKLLINYNKIESWYACTPYRVPPSIPHECPLRFLLNQTIWGLTKLTMKSINVYGNKYMCYETYFIMNLMKLVKHQKYWYILYEFGHHKTVWLTTWSTDTLCETDEVHHALRWQLPAPPRERAYALVLKTVAYS
jgi:hypothetical protein